MSATPLISLQDVSLGIDRQPLFAGLDLMLHAGERACLVGRNGSGKSTLLRVLAGLVEPESGERAVQAGVRLAYLAQEPQLPPEQSVADYITGGLPPAEAEERYRVDVMLERFELDGEARLGALSGGEARRAALAQGLVGVPCVLLLDWWSHLLDMQSIQVP